MRWTDENAGRRRQGDSSHRLDATAHRLSTPGIQFGVRRSPLIFQSSTCRLLSRIALFHKKTRWADESTGGVSFRRVLPSSRCHRSPLNYLRNHRLFCCSDIRLVFFVRFRMMSLRPFLWSTGSFELLFSLWLYSDKLSAVCDQQISSRP